MKTAATGEQNTQEAFLLRNEDLAGHPGAGRDYPDVCDHLHRAFAAGWVGEKQEGKTRDLPPEQPICLSFSPPLHSS